MMAAAKRWKHRLVVDTTFGEPVSEQAAVVRLAWLLRGDPGHTKVVKTEVKRLRLVLAAEARKVATDLHAEKSHLR